jgi:hypothetical protein
MPSSSRAVLLAGWAVAVGVVVLASDELSRIGAAGIA